MENFTTPNSMHSYMNAIKERLVAAQQQETDSVAKMLANKYQEIEEKLPDDMKSLSAQYLLLFGMILEESDNDAVFKKQLLLPWKTWDRLYASLDRSARPESQKDKNFRPRCAMVDSFTLLEWIKAYYALDDKEDFEKEEKEKAERAAKEEENKKRAKERIEKSKLAKSKSQVKKTEEDNDEEDDVLEDSEESIEHLPSQPGPEVSKKKSKNTCDGQLDFLSLLQD